MSEEIILEARDIWHSYEENDRFSLQGLDLKVKKGSKVAFMGANGSGKSTFFLCCNGILRPQKGDILFHGKPVSYKRKELLALRAKVGIVFQDAESQFTQQTVEDEIAFAMCNFGYERNQMRERVKFAAEACGLMGMLDRSPYHLSGGQQQRLAVASILALQPRVIILDESTSQLDPIGRDEIFRLVGELHRLGKTVIMVDHNIEKIADTVDKVVVLHEGELVAYDEPHIVFGNKNLLNEHFVRVPQVTDAAIALRDRLSIDGRLPITLQEATPIFALLTQGGV